jgi:hypothetical protein
VHGSMEEQEQIPAVLAPEGVVVEVKSPYEVE